MRHLPALALLLLAAVASRGREAAKPLDPVSPLTVAGTETAANLKWDEETRKKPASEVLKNVQVLKDVPAQRFMAAMQSMKATHGVRCDHCHNRENFPSDEKPPKLMARKMLKMAYSINRDHFKSKTEVTCFTCHRGTVKPESAVPPGTPASPKTKLPTLSAEDGAKPAPQVWKNIKVMTNVPAGRLVRVMNTFTLVLGVDCEHCHVDGKWDSDEKKDKETARQMLRMVDAIAKDHFEGKPMVSCFTCHRGQDHPPKSAKEVAAAAVL